MKMVDWYIQRLVNAVSLSVMNDIVEEAANDDRLTNEEYQRIYLEALKMV